jgi:hypothetical protein
MENADNNNRNLPEWMMIAWYASAPFAVMLAVRLLWEKTVWTWNRGPQMVGFSLVHIHPFFAIAGALSSFVMIGVLVVGIVLSSIRRRRFRAVEVAMFACSAFVLFAMFVPDTFFAR